MRARRQTPASAVARRAPAREARWQSLGGEDDATTQRAYTDETLPRTALADRRRRQRRAEGDGRRARARGGGRSLGLDPLDAQIRQVFFFDTPDLALSKQGVVVRARRVQKRRDDSVIKLRPVVPAELPKASGNRPRSPVEVDALPGGFVCSGTMKTMLGDDDVRESVRGKRPIAKLFSKEQRRLYAEHDRSRQAATRVPGSRGAGECGPGRGPGSRPLPGTGRRGVRRRGYGDVDRAVGPVDQEPVRAPSLRTASSTAPRRPRAVRAHPAPASSSASSGASPSRPEPGGDVRGRAARPTGARVTAGRPACSPVGSGPAPRRRRSVTVDPVGPQGAGQRRCRARRVSPSSSGAELLDRGCRAGRAARPGSRRARRGRSRRRCRRSTW